MIEKLILPFPLLSDPDGEVSKRYGVWDEEGQVARPAILIVDPARILRYVYVGEDFADRPGDEPVFEALRAASGGGH